MQELRLSGYREPLGLWTRKRPSPERAPGVRSRRVEFSSRGDRACLQLWLPEDRVGDRPLLLLQPDPAAPDASATLADAALTWVERGVAVASLDLPLHGRRADHKLAARLRGALRPDTTGDDLALASEFARQSVIDFERSLDALAAQGEIDVDRVAYAGIGLAAWVGIAFCALDPRPRAAVFARCGAGVAPDALDPGRYVGRLAPRPTLLLHAPDDPAVPDAAARALAEAAGDGSRSATLATSREALPADALASIVDFLSPELAAA